MTKLESLAKDCIENHTHRLVDKPTKQDIYLREESIFIQGYRQSEKRIAELEKDVKLLGGRCNQLLADKGKLTDENTELKVRIGLSIECEKAQKNGELCLGYAGDEDEPCERCKNCIKCECGYYQLGETEKDEQLNKAKDLIEDMYDKIPASHSDYYKDVMERARQFLQECE